MIYYTSASGQVIGGTAGSDLTGITHLPANSEFAIFIDDATIASLNPNNLPGTYTMSNIVAGSIYSVPTATGVLQFTEQPASEQLSSAQSARQAYLTNSFNQAILAGFSSSADGTARTYAIDPVSMGKWTGTLSLINSGGVTSDIQVKDISGTKVTLTTTQFKQFALDGFTYFNNQEQNLWAKEVDVENATTIADVNAITY